MIHSVFDWHHLRYDYFQTPTKASVGGWKPLTGLGISGKASSASGVGIDIEEALPPLPKDAVPIGQGVIARGQVCRKGPAPNALPTGGLTGVLDSPSKRNALGAFLFGLSVGSLVGNNKTLMIGGLATTALIIGLSVERDH